LKPGINIHQWLRSNAAGPSLSVAATSHETRRLEDADVLGDGARRHLERLREFSDGRFAFQKARQYGASRWIGERGERCAELIVNHCGTTSLRNH
jgi:hypothetical protein